MGFQRQEVWRGDESEHPASHFSLREKWGTRHRTRSHERSVNLCFEDLGAYTDVVFAEEPVS